MAAYFDNSVVYFKNISQPWLIPSECIKGVSRQHMIKTSWVPHAACSNEFFLWRVDYAMASSMF